MAYCGWGTETRRHRASRQHARRPPSHRQRAPADSVERLLGRPGKSAVKTNSGSVACWWSEVRYVCVNNLPVAVTLLEHQRNSDSRQRAELLRDIRRSRRWHNCGCVAEEACDSDGPVAIELDEPIAIHTRSALISCACPFISIASSSVPYRSMSRLIASMSPVR